MFLLIKDTGVSQIVKNLLLYQAEGYEE